MYAILASLVPYGWGTWLYACHGLACINACMDCTIELHLKILLPRKVLMVNIE